MESWVITIFRMKAKLATIIMLLDKRVDALSLNPLANEATFNEIMSLNEKKISVINLRVLFNSVFAKLDDKERAVACGIAKRKTLTLIAEEMKIKGGAVSRIKEKIILKATKVLKAMGYDVDRLNAEYGKIALVNRTRASVLRSCKRHSKENCDSIEAVEKNQNKTAIVFPQNNETFCSAT